MAGLKHQQPATVKRQRQPQRRRLPHRCVRAHARAPRRRPHTNRRLSLRRPSLAAAAATPHQNQNSYVDMNSVLHNTLRNGARARRDTHIARARVMSASFATLLRARSPLYALWLRPPWQRKSSRSHSYPSLTQTTTKQQQTNTKKQPTN